MSRKKKQPEPNVIQLANMAERVVPGFTITNLSEADIRALRDRRAASPPPQSQELVERWHSLAMAAGQASVDNGGTPYDAGFADGLNKCAEELSGAALPPAHGWQPTIGQAFKAGYHCVWSLQGYLFEPSLAPGDPEGAFEAWLKSLASPVARPTEQR